MKAEELMINDWVFEGKDHPIKVVKNYGRSLMYTDEYPHEIEETYLSPIPLTEEILRANGFVTHDNEMLLRKRGSEYEYYHIDYYITTDNHYILDIESADKNGTMTRVHQVQFYAHELQHAMRLCGLKELADNFKIE